MIDLTGCIAIPLLKKSAFTGSYKGMRYRLKKETAPCGDQEDENDDGCADLQRRALEALSKELGHGGGVKVLGHDAGPAPQHHPHQ